MLGELPDLPHLPELPGRGAHRGDDRPGAGASSTELGADLQPAGWRLTDAAGRRPPPGAQPARPGPRRARGAGAEGYVGRVQGPGRRAVDARRDRREAARRQGAQRPRRPARAGPGARRGAARPRRRRTPPAAAASTGSSSRSTSPRWPPCWPARCRPRPASAGTAPSTRPRPRTRSAGCSPRSPRRAPSRGCTPARRRRPLDLLRGAGARGLSVDLAADVGRRPRRARRGARGRGDGRPRRRAVAPTRPRRPAEAEVAERVLRWLDMLGLDPATVGRPAGALPPAGWPARRRRGRARRSSCAAARRPSTGPD